MTSQSGSTVNGILLRHNDGLYFIPEAQLNSFRVPDQAVSQAEQMVEEGPEVQGYEMGSGSTSVLGNIRVPTGVSQGGGSMW